MSCSATTPRGRTARLATPPDLEEGTWTALLTVYLSPLQDEQDPFRAIRAALTPWSGGELPDLEGVELGPRTSHDPARGPETLVAYRQWAERAGSQAQALAGDGGWSASRRFERAFERLGLPGLTRAARFDLLVALGVSACTRWRPTRCSSSATTRSRSPPSASSASATASTSSDAPARSSEAVEVPLQALDLALANWAAPERMTLGVSPDVADEDVDGRARDALDL